MALADLRDVVMAAASPDQYDFHNAWTHDLSRPPEVQAMLLGSVISHAGGPIKAKRTLDIGSGEGWLCNELAVLGASPVGIEPSQRHVEAARARYPGIEFSHTSLADFRSTERFKLITASMVTEHLDDLVDSLSLVRSFLRTTGRLVIISGDPASFTRSRAGNKVNSYEIDEGVSAVTVDKGERGILHDIIRTPERIALDAEEAGLRLITFGQIMLGDWPKARSEGETTDPLAPFMNAFGFEKN